MQEKVDVSFTCFHVTTIIKIGLSLIEVLATVFCVPRMSILETEAVVTQSLLNWFSVLNKNKEMQCSLAVNGIFSGYCEGYLACA